MDLLKLFRRLAASGSGQLLFVGCGIAAVLCLMWLARFAPWVERSAGVLLGCFVLAVVLFGYIDEWRAAPKRLTWFLTHPLVMTLTVAQVILILLFMASVWTDAMGSSEGARMRQFLVIILFSVTAWRREIRHRNEKSGKVSQ